MVDTGKGAIRCLFYDTVQDKHALLARQSKPGQQGTLMPRGSIALVNPSLQSRFVHLRRLPPPPHLLLQLLDGLHLLHRHQAVQVERDLDLELGRLGARRDLDGRTT